MFGGESLASAKTAEEAAKCKRMMVANDSRFTALIDCIEIFTKEEIFTILSGIYLTN